MRKANERPKDFYAWLCRQYWTKEVLEISYANTLPPDAAEAFRIFPIAYNALNLLAEQPGRVIRTVDEADNRNVARDVFLAVSKHCRYRACEKLKREEAIANALAYPMVEVKEELGSSGDDFMNWPFRTVGLIWLFPTMKECIFDTFKLILNLLWS